MTDVEQLRGKRVLVTGAAGFIGSRLVRALLECGAEVVAVVDEGSSLARIEHLLADQRFHLSRTSLSNGHLPAAQKSWGRIDLVAHLGLHVPQAASFYEGCMEDVTLNLLPTIKLIKALGPSIQGICFASSVSVYGAPSRLPVKEEDPPSPLSSYGATKLAIEHYLKVYGQVNKVPVTILRYATVYGPGELAHRAIPNFLNALRKGQPPQIEGDGSEQRDYVYVDDVVQATLRALARRPAQVLNIGSGCGHTTLQIAREVTRLYSNNAEPQFSPGKHAINIVCDISAARKALDYTPQTSLEEGLAKEIEWYRKEASSVSSTGKQELRKRSAYPSLKSILDRFFAFLTLVVLSPALALTAIAIRLDSPGNPIFAQERVGENGRRFKAYKFRSMRANADDAEYKAYLRQYVLKNEPYRVDENGRGIYKVEGSSHVTRVGALLRKTNLDELPQIINVLKGEMSFIGPRPDVPFAVEMYSDWHQGRLCIKPGITGLWQVNGRKSLSFEDMVRVDIEYIRRQSLLLDTRILLRTVATVLKMDGS